MKNRDRCHHHAPALSPLAIAATTAALLSACGGSDSPATSTAVVPPTVQALACDDTLKSAFKPDSNTTVLLAHAFKKGDALSLATTPPANAPTASAAVCVVKLLVGPGNTGVAGVPSTTAGMGFEIWLPATAAWDGRIRAEAPGAFMGSASVTSLTALASTTLAAFAAANGTVTVTTDGGNTRGGFGDYLTQPDGTPNALGWKQISFQTVHEMSLKTKALANGYYSKAADRTYVYGCSSGGRAVYQSAQMFPTDYDGIVADAVSLDQTQYFPGLMWAQLVMQRDLADKGLPLLSQAKRDAVSTAALQACDTTVNGTHDGYLTDYRHCKYDPAKDAALLCTSDGGTNASAACVTKVEAQVFNKIWYGVTADGSVPDPVVDNGVNDFRAPNQLWWGHKRGTGLDFVANSANNLPAMGILDVVVDQIAWNLQDLSYTRSSYANSSGAGQNRWRGMSYGQFAQSFYQGKALNDVVFANIDSNNPDLSKFRDTGAKMISMVGVADQFVSVEAMRNYYTRSAALVGGNAQAQQFHRLFTVPGRGHCGGTGSIGAGGGNPPQVTADQMYFSVVDWVEKKKTPSSIVATTPDGTKSRPLCVYPTEVKYLGGDVNAAASYTCQ